MKKLLLLGLTVIGVATLSGCDLRAMLYKLDGVDVYSYSEFLGKMSKLETPYKTATKYDNHGNKQGVYTFKEEDHGWYNPATSEFEGPLYLEAYYFLLDLEGKTEALGKNISTAYEFGYIKKDKLYEVVNVQTKEDKEIEFEYRISITEEGMVYKTVISSNDESGEFHYHQYNVYRYEK